MGRPFKKTGKPLRRGENAVQARASSHPVSTSVGRAVRSRPERVCVNFFTKNNIEFVYEPWLLLCGRKYRPDFFIPSKNLFIEICGYTHMPDYRERMEEKRQVYASQGLNVLFLESQTGNTILMQLRRIFLEIESGSAPESSQTD